LDFNWSSSFYKFTIMKSFQQFQEDQSKNPFIDQKTGRQNVGPFDYGHNPPIHGLKSGHKYPNNILDREGKEKDQYLQEPEVMKFFRDNDNKIKSRSEGPGGLSPFKYFSNPYVKKGQSAVNAPKGVFPKG